MIGLAWETGAWRGEAALSLAPEDEVEFSVVINRKTGGFRAEDVELLCKAEDRRELGQVSANMWPSDNVYPQDSIV